MTVDTLTDDVAADTAVATAVAGAAVLDPAHPSADPGTPAAGPTPPVPAPTGEPDDEPVLSVPRVVLVGALAAAASGVVLGGLFEGVLGRIVGVLAGLLGAGLVGLGLRTGRTWLQYLAAPAVFVAGYVAALVLPNPTGVTGTVPELVRQAIRNGGLAHPPVPFDPGWRFLLVALVGLMAAAGVSLACGFRKPRLAILLPLPLVVAGALNQPKGHELIGGGIALALMLAALTVSYSAELAGSAEMTRSFEMRQLGTSAVATVAALAVLALLSHASVLFPQPAHSRDTKPQRPKVVPLSEVKDRPLFDAPNAGPWQVGVLSDYADGSWLLPPFDPNDLRPVADGKVPSAPSGPVATVTVTVRQLDGYTLPTPVGATAIGPTTARVGYDAGRGVFRLRDGAVPDGFRYAVTALKLPSGDALATAAQKQAPAALNAYTSAPDVPLFVQQLIAKAPSHNRWDQLQYLRHRLYAKVVATGGGVPVPVSPDKVIDMLNGGKASPFEIVAGEALLARWVGFPSRIGYGYYDGSKVDGGLEFRPRDGRNWLEVWFTGYGWVPVLGTPLHAQSDLNAQKKSQPHIKPASEQTLQIYVPVLNTDPTLAFQVVRWYVVRIVPVLALLWLLWRSIAAPARLLRRRRRRAWAAAYGPAGRIAVAYAEFRDTARDLGVDDGKTTPLEFLDVVEDDTEHRELAWLTTRALWGDLTRDLQDTDADAAEAMSASLQARLLRGQTGLTRIGAFASRASLREPWDAALPNAWVRVRLPRLRRATLRALLRRWRRRLVAAGVRAVPRRAGAA